VTPFEFLVEGRGERDQADDSRDSNEGGEGLHARSRRGRRRKQSHWSSDVATKRMVTTLQPIRAPPLVYGEFDRCFLFTIHRIR
jgi:hypothetical protein